MSSQSATPSSAGHERTTVEFRNEIPFPLKIYRQSGKDAEVFCNLLDGYSRYTQQTAPNDVLIAKLSCNDWEVFRITAHADAQSCTIGPDVLRSKPAAAQEPDVKVVLDMPIRAYEVFRVDEKGKEKSLGKVTQGESTEFEAKAGSIIRGAALGKGSRATYFWLIVTPQGEANILGQTFSTGTGWGIIPEIGEVAVFMDLAVGKDDKYEPEKTPDQPFYMVFHGDVPDLSVFFDTPGVKFSSKARTTKTAITIGKSAAKPKTLDEVLGHIAPKHIKLPSGPFPPGLKLPPEIVKQQAKLTEKTVPSQSSGGPILLAAVTGPGTQAVFYENADFGGDAFSPDNSLLPEDQAAASINIEVTEDAAATGITAYTSLSEDVDFDAKNGGKTTHKFRATLNLPPNLEYVEIATWEEDVEIEVEGTSYRVGPNSPAKIPVDEFGRITVSMAADEAGASEILVRTNKMPQDHSLIVCPDEEMHAKITELPDNALHKSGLADPKYGEDDCGQVQKALQQISKTLINSHAETPAGVTNKRSVDPGQMSDAHWVLSVDSSSGKPTYVPVSAEQAGQINASSSKEIHDTEKNLGQSIFSKINWGKIGKVVVQTAETAGKAVGTVAADVGKTAVISALVPGGPIVGALLASPDGIKFASHEVAKALVVTVHFLEDNVPGLRFVLTGASKVAAQVIKGIVGMVGIVVGKLVEWLSFIFPWKDISHTNDVMVQTFKNGFSKLKGDVVWLKEQTQTQVSNLRNLIEQAKTYKAPPQKKKQPTSPAHSSVLEKVEWFFSFLRKHMPSIKSTPTTKALSGDLARIYNDLRGSLSKLGTDLKNAGGDVVDIGKAIFKLDFSAFLNALKNLALDLVLLIIDAAEAIVVLILDALALLIDLFLAFVGASFEIPVISWLWKTLFGSRLAICPLSVGLILPAIFTTLAFKAAKGHAPFQKVNSLALSADSTAELGYLLAGVDFVSGFACAWTTLQAGASSSTEAVSGGGEAPKFLKIIKVIVTMGKYLHYLMSPALAGSNVGKAVMYCFSAAPLAVNMFGLLPGVDSDFTNRAQVVGDAIYGAAKVVVGATEAASGSGMEGAILMVEGGAAITELTGLFPDPAVFGIGSVASCTIMWTASALHIARAGKL